MIQVLTHLTLLQKRFIALKGKVHKLDINKLANTPMFLDILKTKVDDFSVGKLKTVPKALKKLSIK